MKVVLIDHTVNPELTVGRMAAICYDAKTDRESNIKRAKHCKDAGHLATMRFAYATFNISGISRICSHQMVRIAHAGILQKSQRYCKESEFKVVTPPSFFDTELIQQYELLQAQSQALYEQLIESKVRKEDARYALLHSSETELNMCLNFQGWQDFLNNRTDKAAQWEVREVALEIQKQLRLIAPNLFDK